MIREPFEAGKHYKKFKAFSNETDDLHSEIVRAFRDATDNLIAVENDLLEGKTLGLREDLTRIRIETTNAILELLEQYLPFPKRFEKKPARKREIPCDIASRYMQRFGGHTQWIQTDADNGFPVLIDRDGETRGIISFHVRFEGPPSNISDIPY